MLLYSRGPSSIEPVNDLLWFRFGPALLFYRHRAGTNTSTLNKNIDTMSYNGIMMADENTRHEQ